MVFFGKTKGYINLIKFLKSPVSIIEQEKVTLSNKGKAVNC
jgi:hypothetical protein